MIELAEILKHLSDDLKMQFQEDPTGSYSYQIDETITVQIELAKNEEDVVLGSFFAELPPGKFRENVLGNALKANYILNEPSFFAFSEQNHKLLLYQFLPLKNLNSQKLQEDLTLFSNKALLWQEAIKNNLAAPRDFLHLAATYKS